MTDFRGSVLREIQDPPFRAMACPSHEALTAWMVGYQKCVLYVGTIKGGKSNA